MPYVNKGFTLRSKYADNATTVGIHLTTNARHNLTTTDKRQ